MADKKTGPVKPPIIDAKARQSGSTDNAATHAQAPSAETETASASARHASKTGEPGGTAAPKSDAGERPSDAHRSQNGSATETPMNRTAPGAGAFLATGLGGAALGLALAYGLAATGFWPTPQPDTEPTAPLEARIADLESALSEGAGAEAQTGARIGDLDARLQAVESAVSRLDETTPAAQSDVDALSARVDEIANALSAVTAGTSGTDATRIGADIAALQSRIEALESTLEPLAPALDATRGDVQALDARVADLETALDDQPQVAEITAERDRFAQIPGAIAQLERRVAAGEPFAAALADLEALLPDLDIPAALRAASATGIASTDAITRAFRALMPELLAARPQDPDAGILETLMSQAQSAIALRPAGAIEGDTPDALLARAEAALEDGELERARTTLAALPEPMLRVARPVIEKIDAALAAQDVLNAARDAGIDTGEAAQ